MSAVKILREHLILLNFCLSLRNSTEKSRFKEQSIQLHLLICFIALAVAKHIEIRGKISIRNFITLVKTVTDPRMLNKITKHEIKLRSEIPIPLINLIQILNKPH